MQSLSKTRRNKQSLSKTTEITTTTISTTAQPEIDWEEVNELDEKESERETGIFTPILLNIVNTLMTVGLTIIYGVYQICISSNSTILNNVVPINSYVKYFVSMSIL